MMLLKQSFRLAEHGRVPAQHIILKAVRITERQFLSLIDATTKVIEVPIDELDAVDDFDINDMDNKAEYSRVEDIVQQLPRRHQKAIQDFLDNPDSSIDSIKDVVSLIKTKLNMKDV